MNSSGIHDTLKGPSTSTRTSPPPKRVLVSERRPSAFQGYSMVQPTTITTGPGPVEPPVPSIPPHQQHHLNASTSSSSTTAASIRSSSRTAQQQQQQLEPDFTTTFPPSSSYVTSRPATAPPSTTPSNNGGGGGGGPTTNAAHHALATQHSFINLPNNNNNNNQAPVRSTNQHQQPTSSPLTRTSSSRQGGGPTSSSSAPRMTPSLSSSLPNPRRTEPTLPSSRVIPAPPTGMYWSRCPISGRIPRGLRAHSATVVGGEVWCFGGCDLRGSCFRDVWKLDGDSFIWSKPKVSGTLPPVTRAHTSTPISKRLFIFGGGDGPTYYNETYYFDTVTQTWHRPLIHGTPPSRRRAHTAIHDSSFSRLLIFGGGNGSHALNDLHALTGLDSLDHPESAGGGEGLRWEELKTKGRKPIARGYHSANLVGNKVVVFGGSDGTECFSDVFVLDLETLTWTEIKPDPFDSLSSPSPSFPRLSHTATTVGSYLFIIGGHDGVNFSNEILLFNLVTLQWEPRKTYGAAPSPRGYHATVIYDSRVLLIGGFNGSTVFEEEVYTLDLAGSAFLPQITNFSLITYDDDDEDEREEGFEEVDRREGGGRD